MEQRSGVDAAFRGLTNLQNKLQGFIKQQPLRIFLTFLTKLLRLTLTAPYAPLITRSYSPTTILSNMAIKMES